MVIYYGQLKRLDSGRTDTLVEIEVGPVEAGKRVHRLVRQLLPGVPLSGIYKMIRTGRVKRNGKKAKSEDVVQLGDTIRLYIAEADYEQVSKPVKKFAGVSTDIDVVYEDNEILIVNKPVGLLTHGAEGEYKDTLVNRVLAYLHSRNELQKSVFTPSPVNRLDRNTSGLVIFSKTGETTRTLAEEIRSHHVDKWYIALVKGPIRESGEIRTNLTRVNDARTRVSRTGKESVTKYFPILSRGNTTLVRIQLVSGRTHQIRAHFSHIGHPLVGDVKYGGGSPVKEGNAIHQWLHAITIQLPDGREFHAPLPDAFVAKLRELGYSDKDLDKLH